MRRSLNSIGAGRRTSAGAVTLLVVSGLCADRAAAHNHHPDLSALQAQTDAPKKPIAKKARDKRKLYVITDEKAFVADVCDKVEKAAHQHGLPPAFLAKLIWTESRFDPNAISPVGAEGIAQFMPYTASTWNLKNSFEPIAAIDASARLLSYLYRGYGNLGLAAAAYNAGERRVNLWRSGKSGLPTETRNYVYTITGHNASAWMKAPVPKVTFILDEVTPFQESCQQFPIITAPLQRHLANTYYNRGLSLTLKKDYVNAINRYSVAIRLKPNFPHAYNNRGLVYRKMKDYDTAIANYDAAIKQKSNYAAAYNNRGYAKRKLDRYEEALRDYDQAIKFSPNYVAAHFNRGFANAKLGRFKQAIGDYSKTLKLNSKHALALYNRALAHMELGESAKAEADFSRAIAVYPKFAKAYYSRAALLHGLGKKQRASKDYEKSIALNPTFSNRQFKQAFK